MNYYTSYADHMWRFYTRHRNADIRTMTDVSRANWTACDSVFSSLTETDRSCVQLYYSTPRNNTGTAIKSWCHDNNVTLSDAWTTIHSAQSMAAVARGLVEERTATRKAEDNGNMKE